MRQRKFPVARAKLIHEYEGDDDVSMEQNNTSAFNVRQVTGGGTTSLHAYGVAIDLNPIQNPYFRRSGGKVAVSPQSGAGYINRKLMRPGMAESVVDVFASHGFTIWGGHWKNPTDYQHFQVSRKMTDQLIRSPPATAQLHFQRSIEKHRACMQASGITKLIQPCAELE
jgi:hypothetical protein